MTLNSGPQKTLLKNIPEWEYLEFLPYFCPFSCVLKYFCVHFLQLAGLWEEKLKEEQTKTGPLEEVCAALREALDAEHKKRMEAFENKMKPIIIKDGPSKKVQLHFRFVFVSLVLISLANSKVKRSLRTFSGNFYFNVHLIRMHRLFWDFVHMFCFIQIFE